MKRSYFKFRRRFDFKSHRYEIGNPVIQNKRLENNFFFKKLSEIEEVEYDDYFSFHQHYYVEQFPTEGHLFLLHVLELVDKRIENYDRKDFYKNAASTLNDLDIFKSFREVLMRKGNWDNDTPAYYFLFHYRAISIAKDKLRKCPSCNGEWLLNEKWLGFYDFKCDKCKLVSTLTGKS